MKSIELIKRNSWGLIVLAFLTSLSCTSNRVPLTAPTNSTSASEVVAAIISGTVNVTMSTGSQASRSEKKSFFESLAQEITLVPQAAAQITPNATCPTLQAGGAECTVNGSVMQLVYKACNFTSQPLGVVWQGAMYLTSTNPSAPITWQCGTFPTFAAGNVITRTFSSPTGRTLLATTAGSASGRPYLGTLVDTSGSTFGTNPVVINSGIVITFTGAVARTIVINGIHIGANSSNFNVWDYQLSTSSTGLAVNAANSVTSGSVVVQDRKISGRTATSTITTALTYTAGCCMPTGGVITTAWNDGTTNEVLTFTGACQAGQLTNQSGTQNITLTQCL